MKVHFLGTGTSQGIPVIGCCCPVCLSSDPKDKRLRTSALIDVQGITVVIDTGPDFRYQMLRAKVQRLDAVLFTHPHRDHTAGLDDIRPFYFRQRKPIPIFANAFTLEHLKKTYDYIFSQKNYPGVPQVEIHSIEDKPFKVYDVEVIPIPGLHKDMPVIGFRFNDFAYLTDFNYLFPSAYERLQGVKVLVLNALRHKAHYSHFNLEQALAEIERIAPETAYLTHISHELGKHEEVEKQLPQHVHLAYDTLELYL